MQARRTVSASSARGEVFCAFIRRSLPQVPAARRTAISDRIVSMAQSIAFTAPRMRAAQPAGTRQVAVWLLICCALVFAMVVVGGITRLTHSGLSIVEWQPIVGTIPPLDQAQWQ